MGFAGISQITYSTYVGLSIIMYVGRIIPSPVEPLHYPVTVNYRSKIIQYYEVTSNMNIMGYITLATAENCM